MPDLHQSATFSARKLIDLPRWLGHGEAFQYHPDGICVDTTGAVWYADVGHQHCVRVREGGTVLATVDLDRGAFACALSRDSTSPEATSRPGSSCPTLFVVGQNWGGPNAVGGATGYVATFPAPAPGAGHP
jgi:sugar lactone lactonase YvrE